MRTGRGWSLVGMVAMVGALLAAPAAAGPPDRADEGLDRAAAVAASWTPERVANAIPRDLLVDPDGLGWIRGPEGLEPHGHDGGRLGAPRVTAAPTSPSPRAKPPSGGNDTTPPTVTGMDPASGQVIGAAHGFRATVTDDSGVRAVTFTVVYPSGATQDFSASDRGGDVWGVDLSGFSDGSWGWYVTAKDTARKGGNSTTTSTVAFTVDTGGGGDPPPPPPPGGVITDGHWQGGAVQTAVGRILFEMPTNRKGNRWADYVCSGNVVADATSGRSVLLTAAHCVYDDASKRFARNVLFVPSQDDGGADGSDRICTNDPLGCWAPDHGVVDDDWASRTWPDNIPWDYGYYVVDDVGSHAGNGTGGALDQAAGSLAVQWSAPAIGAVTHALGYSYSRDPLFRYCKEGMATEGADNWWLPSCELTGGASGGAWIQPMDEATGSGPVISVNSWGWSNQPGMAGPRLSGTSAQCVFTTALGTSLGSVPDRGVTPAC